MCFRKMFRSKVVSFLIVLAISVLGCSAQYVRRKPSFNGRFKGDQLTEIENAPYHVSLEFLIFHTCSGAIIGDDLIVTAAQCVWRKNQRSLRVRLGTDTYGRGGEVFKIRKIVAHENFNERTKDFDIALIWLENKIDFDDKKSPVEVSADEPTVDSGATATGWNTLGLGLVRNLQEASMNITDRNECSNTYQRVGGITENMLCAVNSNNGCGGDVGGPLVSEDTGSLIGVVSWGEGCLDRKKPVVYSKISALAQWIQDESAKN